MIVVLVEPAQLLWFLGTLQLASHVAVLRAVACLDRQTTVCPKLPLRAEPMRSLDQRNQQSGPNRANVRNLPQQLRRSMFPALGQQVPSHDLAQSSHRIELLVEEL